MKNWNDVNVTLPNREDYFLVVDCGKIVVRSFNDYHNCWDDEQADDYYCDPKGGRITHWMELPCLP